MSDCFSFLFSKVFFLIPKFFCSLSTHCSLHCYDCMGTTYFKCFTVLDIYILSVEIILRTSHSSHIAHKYSVYKFPIVLFISLFIHNTFFLEILLPSNIFLFFWRHVHFCASLYSSGLLYQDCRID